MTDLMRAQVERDPELFESAIDQTMDGWTGPSAENWERMMRNKLQHARKAWHSARVEA